MIRYALKCPDGHRFESWFQNAAACDALVAAGHVTCPECGKEDVEKCLMTPDVRPARANAPQDGAKGAPAAAADNALPSPDHPLAPQTAQEREIAAVKARLEAEGEYVGGAFADEARAIHDGAAPERPIYGEAALTEAIALIEDGIPVAPLPFTPTRKTN